MGCDRDEPIPSYISVENFNLEIAPENASLQGVNSQEIGEVSVSADGQVIGIFTLPAEVPILEEGSTLINLSPVIRQNGQSDERVVYPFYEFYASTEDLVKEQVISISPEISYRENLNFHVEDFTNTVDFSDDVVSEGYFDRTTDTDLVFGGEGGSAYSVMEEDGESFYAETNEEFNWPSGQPVFLEIDYSCNQSFAIGAVATTGVDISRTELLIVLPTQESDEVEWRKLYVNLTDFVFDNNNANTRYEVFFAFSKSSPESVIYLDNLKVIYP